MKRSRFSLVFPLLYLLIVLPSSAQNVQFSASAEAAIVADLESGDTNRISLALEALPYPYEDSLYKDKISHRMALALIEASERQTDLYFRTPDEDDNEEMHDEFASGLSDYVVPLRMPEAIPALLKATQFGNPAAYALADFGPDIVYNIIEYIDDSERNYKEIRGAFFALGRTIETHQPLSASIRSAVKEITMRYLERAEEYYRGPDGATTVTSGAISVARILGDPDLKQMVVDILPLEEERNVQFNGFGTHWAQYTLEIWDEGPPQYPDLKD